MSKLSNNHCSSFRLTSQTCTRPSIHRRNENKTCFSKNQKVNTAILVGCWKCNRVLHLVLFFLFLSSQKARVHQFMKSRFKLFLVSLWRVRLCKCSYNTWSSLWKNFCSLYDWQCKTKATLWLPAMCSTLMHVVSEIFFKVCSVLCCVMLNFDANGV